MAYQKHRLRRKTADGYDVYHLESNSDVILRFTETGLANGTVETALKNLERGVDQRVLTVPSATVGNLTQFAANGQISDSGKTINDFAEADHSHDSSDIGGMTANRVAISDEDGILASSSITGDELFYLTGVTSNIQTQLNAINTEVGKRVPNSSIGVNGGIVPLNETGQIDSQYLPSYVDDIIDGTYVNETTFNDTDGSPVTPEGGKIYLDTTTNKSYRWSGSVYVELFKSIALGTTSSTAFRGDYGQIAYQHSQSAHAPADATKTEKSNTNGNIRIDNVEVTVYTHPTYSGTKSTANTNADGTLVALTAVTLENGHISGYTETTYTLPSSVDIKVQSSQPTDQKEGDLWYQTIT